METLTLVKYYDKEKDEYRYELTLPGGEVLDYGAAGDMLNFIMGFTEFQPDSKVVLVSKVRPRE